MRLDQQEGKSCFKDSGFPIPLKGFICIDSNRLVSLSKYFIAASDLFFLIDSSCRIASSVHSKTNCLCN